MSIHDGFLELAATAIDFDLEADERAELERHLAGCDACRRTAAAISRGRDGDRVRDGPRLSPARSVEILATALRPPKSGPPLRLLGDRRGGRGPRRRARRGGHGVPAATQAIRSSRSCRRPSAFRRLGTLDRPTAPRDRPGRPSAGPPHPAARLPRVRCRSAAPGSELGTEIRMAPGPTATSTSRFPGPTARRWSALDGDGTTRSGWPIVLPGATPCGLLLAVADGSVRVVCDATDLASDDAGPAVRAFAFDAGGRPAARLAGRPSVLLHRADARRRVDDATAGSTSGTSSRRVSRPGRAGSSPMAADGTVAQRRPGPVRTRLLPRHLGRRAGRGRLRDGPRLLRRVRRRRQLSAVGFDRRPGRLPGHDRRHCLRTRRSTSSAAST